MKTIGTKSFNLLLTLFLSVVVGLGNLSAQAADSKGTDFWVAFQTNYSGELALFISGETAANVQVTAGGVTNSYTVVPGAVVKAPIPVSQMMSTSDGIESKGIHVTSNNEVTVYALNQRYATTDAFLALPSDILGTEYIAMAYGSSNDQMAIVATTNATTVSITPKNTIGGRTAGVPYNISLNAGQVYQLRGNNITGTTISSNKPVGVFGGNQCIRIGNGACDHIAEQLPPISAWGKNFVALGLQTRPNSYIKVLATDDNTQVNINGTLVATLNNGDSYGSFYPGNVQITANNPVLVGQFAPGNGTTTGDPFFMLIPPYEQYLASYTVATPVTNFTEHYLNIIVPANGTNSVVLDGTTLSSGSFSPIGSSGFYGGAIAVSAGNHTVTSTYPIGVHSYGWGFYDSYGYPGGQSLSPVAFVSNLSVSPQTATVYEGTQQCFTTTITDNQNNPVEGIRVDFAVSGANNASGFANTDANGNANFCYTPANSGTDNLTTSSGSLSGSAVVNVLPCTLTASGTSSNIYCGAATGGSIDITASSSAGGISYAWSNGATSEDLSNLPPGNYQVVVSDANNCSETLNFTIIQAADDILPTVVTQNITVQLGSSGGVRITVADIDAGSSDNCGITSRTVGPGVFNCSNLGNNTVTLTAYDAAGNYASATATVTVVDNILPTVVGNNISVNLDNTGNYTLSQADINTMGAGSADNCSFTLSITNGNTSFNCTEAKQSHTLTLTATDASGNTASTPVTVTVTDDNSVCNAPPVAVCQTATLNADGNCSAMLTAADVDGGSSDPDGDVLTYTLDNYGPFGLGTHTVNLTVSDGEYSDVCTTTITVQDITPPVIQGENSNLTMTFDAGVGNPPSYTEDGITFLSLYGSSSHVHLGDNDNDGSNDIRNHSGCCSTPYRLTVGANTEFTLISMEVKSVTGNPSFYVYPSGASVTITSTGTFTFPAGFEDVTEVRWAQDAGNMTIDNLVVSTKTAGSCPEDIATANDPGICGATVNFSANALDNCSANVSFSPTSGSLFPIGITQVIATATDPSGNSTNCSFNVTVNDTEVPNVLTQNITVQLDNSGNASINASDINAGSTDNCGIASVSVSPGSFTCTHLGVNTVTLTVTDIYGNTNTATANVTVEDNVAPVALAQDITVQLDANGQASITAADVNAGSNDACGIASLSVSPSSFDCSNVGANTVTLTATDASGNTHSTTATVNVIDTIAPTILSCVQDVTLPNTPLNCLSLYSWVDPVVTDNCDPSGVTFSYSAPGIYMIDLQGVTLANFPVGTTTVTVSAMDVNGNISQCNFNVTIQDTEAPTFTGCPGGDVVVSSDPGLCAAVVNWQPITASDNCPGVSVVQSHFPGSTFPVGTTAVSYTATDASGNTNTCSFNVVVEDNELPQVVTQNLTVQLDPSGNASIAVSNIENGSTDNCGIAGSNLNITNFNCANVGPNMVTLSVTDIHGNVNTATATVTVEDNVLPIALAQNITVQLDASGNASIAAADVDAGSNDACGITSLSVSPSSFTCANVGTNTVTLAVTDVNGNVNTATATVTVEDNVLPMALAQNITVQLDAYGNANIAATDVDAGSNDACGIASLSVSPSNFTCANIGANTVTLTVTDVNGNVNTAAAAVTIEDNVLPIALAQNITVQLDASGNASIAAADVDAGSNDACGIASLSVSPSSFTCANVGTNTVTLAVTDVNGNVNTTTAMVTVEDNVLPVTLAQNITVQLDASGNAFIAGADVDAGSNDACGIASLSVSPGNFTCAHVGANTVTLTATDANGNVNTATATVTVEDNVLPVALAQNITVQLDASGNASIAPSDVDAGSNDACGIASVSVSPGNFTCAHVGANTVTLTATDVNGNVNTATATVTVEDNVLPIALAQNITVQLDASGNAGIAAADVDAGSNDACGIAGLSVSQESFDCSHVGANTVTLTVTDVNGNVNTATATVTVEDNVLPVALAQNITISLDQNDMASISAADVDAGSSDACGIASMSVSPSSFGCATLGSNTVTLTVTDVNGNTSVTTATVTVEQGHFLEISAQANITKNCNFAVSGNYVSWPEPSVRGFSSCSPDTCPVSTQIPGFTYLGKHNGHRYYRSDSRNYTWPQAQAAASAIGGHLVSINSAAENHWIACRLNKSRAWIGLTDEASEGNFSWTNGEALTYTNWKRNEPNNSGGRRCYPDGGADYTTIKRNHGTWEDKRGCDRNEFIMEVPCGNNVEIQQIEGPASGSLFASNSNTQITYVATDSITGATDTMRFVVTVEECVQNYCTATGNNTCYEWIDKVKIANVNNQSGNNNGYGDYTNLTANLTAGQYVNLRLTPGFSNNNYKEYWTVYIDWNGDGDFRDWGECVLTEKGRGTISRYIRVPSWASSGNFRMRVMMSWCGYMSSCASFAYGEVEDYTISVSGQGACKTVVDPIAVNLPVEGGVSFELMGLYPNPVISNEQINVYIRSLEAKTATVHIVDISGRVLYMEDSNLMEGENSLRLETKGLTPGVYFVTIEGYNQSLKFVVNR